ncbi:MAG TPA: N-acetyl-gamma-glutamyl-phosphate reductase [Gammaproteobacteria bacterium]|nr:N-acetyl-gamma-glutamyl-phosphate reductase [Gammaproteobacteria bacterium]
MTYRIFVDGQEGTTGLQIHALLARRPDLEVLSIDPAQRKERSARARLLNAADVAFLCLPDEAAREAVSLVTNPNTCIIDASTAHRTAPGWVYGLPELTPAQRTALRRTKRISNPGCHATAFILLVRPLIDAGLLPADALLTATSLTGYSGGGRKMIEQYTAGGEPELTAPRPYALSLAHKHLPEMAAHTGLVHRPLFLPVVANFYKGLAISVPLHLPQLAPGTDGAAVQRALAARYAGERYVQVRPIGAATGFQDGFFDVQACKDTNRCDLFVFANAAQVLLVARLDNLGKGASGAAVQSMNIHLGCDEAAGLEHDGD